MEPYIANKVMVEGGGGGGGGESDKTTHNSFFAEYVFLLL